MIDTKSAIRRLLDTSQQLQVSHEQLVADWSPDVPPTTIIFSTFGQSLCIHSSTLPKAELSEILNVAEDLLVHGDEAVKNAVATGMLEAILAQSSSGEFDMLTVAHFLGSETVLYCKSWDAFTGIKTPGLW